MDQHGQGGAVRPVKVLQYQQQRSGPRQLGEQDRYSLQQAEAVQLLDYYCICYSGSTSQFCRRFDCFDTTEMEPDKPRQRD